MRPRSRKRKNTGLQKNRNKKVPKLNETVNVEETEGQDKTSLKDDQKITTSQLHGAVNENVDEEKEDSAKGSSDERVKESDMNKEYGSLESNNGHVQDGINNLKNLKGFEEENETQVAPHITEKDTIDFKGVNDVKCIEINASGVFINANNNGQLQDDLKANAFQSIEAHDKQNIIKTALPKSELDANNNERNTSATSVELETLFNETFEEKNYIEDDKGIALQCKEDTGKTDNLEKSLSSTDLVKNKILVSVQQINKDNMPILKDKTNSNEINTVDITAEKCKTKDKFDNSEINGEATKEHNDTNMPFIVTDDGCDMKQINADKKMLKQDEYIADDVDIKEEIIHEEEVNEVQTIISSADPITEEIQLMNTQEYGQPINVVTSVEILVNSDIDITAASQDNASTRLKSPTVEQSLTYSTAVASKQDNNVLLPITKSPIHLGEDAHSATGSVLENATPQSDIEASDNSVLDSTALDLAAGCAAHLRESPVEASIVPVLDDITDSQLCALDWSSQFPTENCTLSPSTPFQLDIEDGSGIMAGLIKEVAQLNKMILKSKREIESARRQTKTSTKPR